MWEGVKKVIYVITVLLGVMILIFLMLRIIPGDTASVLLNDHVNQEALARMTENLGLDKPLPVQFFRYLTGVLRGDLGQSFYYNRPVLSLIAEAFPNTLLLSVMAALFAWVFGILAGVISVPGLSFQRAVTSRNFRSGLYDSIISAVYFLFSSFFISPEL